MKLIDLHLKSFRQHRDSYIRFPEEGLIGILGPNEGGKSTVLEGITFALYGAPATRGTVGSIRSNRAVGSEQASVELRFEVGGKTYRIRRTQKQAWMWEGEEQIARSISGVNSRAARIVGMTLEEFQSTYLATQKDLGRLKSLGGVERRQFVLGVVGLRRVDEALRACRARKNTLATEREGLEAGLGPREPLEQTVAEASDGIEKALAAAGDANDRLDEATGIAGDANDRLAESTTRKEKYETLRRQQEQAGRDQSTALEELKTLGERIARAGEAVERIADAEAQLAALPELRERYVEGKEAKARAEERRRLVHQVGTLAQELEQMQGRITELRTQLGEEPAAADTLQAQLASLQARLEKLKSERLEQIALAKSSAEVALAEAEKAAAKASKIEKLGTEGECPTCTRPLGEHYRPVLEGLREIERTHLADHKDLAGKARELSMVPDIEMDLDLELGQLRKQLEEAQLAAERHRTATTRITEIEAEISRRTEQKAEVEKTLAGIPEAQVDEEVLKHQAARITQLEELERRTAQDRATAATLEALEQDRARAEEKRARAEAAINELDEAITGTGFSPIAHQDLVTQAESARRSHEEAKLAQVRAEEALKAAQEAHRRARKALEDWDGRAGRLHEVAEDLRIHERTAARLNDFRTAMASSIRPELEELVSAFVHTLTDGRHESVTLTEDFEVVLQEGGTDVEVVSGGAEDVTSLALRLAISHLIASRAGHPLSLLILDEPFGSLDEVRRRNVVDLLQHLRGVFAQVLVISHVEDTKDAVDYALHVTFDEGQGTSVITPSWDMAGQETELEQVEAELATA